LNRKSAAFLTYKHDGMRFIKCGNLLVPCHVIEEVKNASIEIADKEGKSECISYM
jgi:hypothetical protein